MILKHFRHLSAALALVCGPALAAPSIDDAVTGAYDAYRAGDALKFARHAKRLEGHLLAPWIEYWRLALRLEDASASDIGEFFSRHGNTYAAERLRAEWLKVLGKRGDWPEFDRESALYAREDLEIRCYGWLSRLRHGDDSVFSETEPMWLEPKELPEGCATLTEALLARGQLSVNDVWRRARLLFESGQITAAKTALGYLPKDQSPDERALAEAARQPKRLIDRLPKKLERRAAREVAVLAGVRFARNDPHAAAEALEQRLGSRLPEADLKYLWGRVGVEAAREHHPEALKWYARAAETPLDDEQLAWKVRAALRAASWPTVREAIDRMSVAARQDAAWTYWYGRALAVNGEETGSRAYFLRIAGQPDFYGLLATEELGYIAGLPEEAYVPAEAEVAAAKREPGLLRALELIRLGMRPEGVREWFFSVRYFDDAKLLGAAEFARREEVYDRSIMAADRTVRQHNFGLRYPMPFRHVFREYAKTHGLDEAWVLGLVRQESRFIVDARSSAGAAGLMQLMPATARYVASKIGMRSYRLKGVTEVQTNVSLGTGYLKMVLDQLGHPVLASAAYNAGPSRAQRWRDVKPLEGAIYAETIPFPETRDYVKKVTANAVFYAALDKRVTPIKARLGTIPGRTGVEPALDEELP